MTSFLNKGNATKSQGNENVKFVGSIEAPSKAFLLFFLLPDWLKLNHLKSRMECGFQTFFAPFLLHRSRNNRRDKLSSKFWRETMFRKPHLKLMRWCLVSGTNKVPWNKSSRNLRGPNFFEKLNSLSLPWDFQLNLKIFPEQLKRGKLDGMHFCWWSCHIFSNFPSVFKASKEQDACVIIKSLKMKAKIKRLKPKNSVAPTN